MLAASLDFARTKRCANTRVMTPHSSAGSFADRTKPTLSQSELRIPPAMSNRRDPQARRINLGPHRHSSAGAPSHLLRQRPAAPLELDEGPDRAP